MRSVLRFDSGLSPRANPTAFRVANTGQGTRGQQALEWTPASFPRLAPRGLRRDHRSRSLVTFLIDRDAPQLPEEVLADLLDDIPRVSAEARALLGPMMAARDELRRRLEENEWIELIPEDMESETIAAVDGAFVPESLYAGDLLVTLAVAAEGLTPSGAIGSCPVHSSWNRFLVHDFDVDRLAKAAMTAQELHLLTKLPHDMCVLDGSHQTPVIQFNSALTSHSPEVRRLAIEVFEEFDTAARLAELCDPETGSRVIASPKADSSRELARFFEKRFNMTLPAADKLLAALVLEEGEMLKAIKAPESWAHLHVSVESIDDKAAKAMARLLDAAIEPLRQRCVRITYIKPKTCSTAIKIEFKEKQGADFRRRVSYQVAAETPGPHLQEPFCQFLADRWAKSAKLGVQAMLQGVRLDLAETDAGVLEYMLRSNRSNGGTA